MIGMYEFISRHTNLAKKHYIYGKINIDQPKKCWIGYIHDRCGSTVVDSPW